MIDCEQLAIFEEYVRQKLGTYASPGFTFGKSGTVKNTFLLCDTVPSNLAGRIIPANGQITEIFGACEDVTSGVITVYKRVGAAFNPLTTLTFSSQRKDIEYKTDVNVSAGDEIAAAVTTGTFKNLVFGFQVRGSL